MCVPRHALLAVTVALLCISTCNAVPTTVRTQLPSLHQRRTTSMQSFMDTLRSAYPSLTSSELDALAAAMQRDRPHTWPQQDNPNIKFDCPTLPPRPRPTDVNDLRPDDIQVVMAIGDSITAGFAEAYQGITSGIQEYRGLSWSIGGDKDAVTVPNFLKNYNPNIQGASLGAGLPGRHEATSHLNAAVSGAIVEDISSQADYLIEHLKKSPSINMKEDWKLLTIMIGPNNLCRACQGAEKNAPPAYEQGFRETLEKLQQNIPRLFVSIVPSPNVTTLYSISEGHAYCEITHSKLCPCAANHDKSVRDKTYDIGLEDHLILNKLAAEWQAKKLQDFAVVIQPFFIETQIPDISYLSGLDCFHPNLYSHQDMAVALWNNMISPAASKEHKWSPGEQPKCPTENSRLYTS